jgi:hypothetical protein
MISYCCLFIPSLGVYKGFAEKMVDLFSNREKLVEMGKYSRRLLMRIIPGKKHPTNCFLFTSLK